MQYRHDAKSGNDLSILGLGCMRFPRSGARIDYKACENIICRAIEHGINYLDTAFSYPGSEEVLGRVLAEHGLRDQVFLASKLPHGRCKSIDDVERLFSTSLERLQTDYLDYYLIHNMVDSAQWEKLVEMGIEDWIARKRQEGAIRQMGFSFHGSNPEFTKIVESYDWDFCQIQYNYMNEHYQAGIEGLKLAASKNMPVIIMEPLLGGKLATGLPQNAARIFDVGCETRSYAEWGLRWLWNQPEVTVVLSGVNALEQLEQNCDAADVATPGCMDLTEQAVIDLVRDEFGKSYKVPCTGCNYCMPCPQGVNIPSCFTSYNESFSLNWHTAFFHHMVTAGASGTSVHLAGDCVRCGACLEKCPQHIEIPDRLAEVKRRMEPGPMRTMLKAFSKVMTR